MITRIVIFLCALAAAGSAQAELVSTEWEGASAGNTSLTLDTTTSLEWLDMSYTHGRTFDDVRANLNGYFAGFRVANYWELIGLLADAGIKQSGFYPKDVGEADAMASLFSLMGKTDSYYLVGRFDGLNIYSSFGNTHPAWRLGLLSDRVSTTSYLDATGIQDDGLGLGYMGTFLVRDAVPVPVPVPVPEPETYAMFLAGLGLIAVAACRKAA